MTIPFFSQHGGQRGTTSDGPELAIDSADNRASDDDDSEAGEQVELDTEVDPQRWSPLSLEVPPDFQPRDFPGRPRRFVDGKDVGQVVAVVRAPAGYPLPVRLSQIGAVVMVDEDGALRRRAEVVERAVTLITQPFPWEQIEGLAIALQTHGLRLVHARSPAVDDEAALFDYRLSRKVTFNASNNEMKQLEEGLAAQLEADSALAASQGPTVIDGRLEPRFAGRDQASAVIGVVKTHQRRYLHPLGLQARYALRPRQRTPLFTLTTGSFPVVSFYLRFASGLPDDGVVRVELPRGAYHAIPAGERRGYIDRLAATLYAYRCRQEDYGRAAVSLHPIVRAEESLGALLQPMNRLVSQFYRMSGL